MNKNLEQPYSIIIITHLFNKNLLSISCMPGIMGLGGCNTGSNINKIENKTINKYNNRLMKEKNLW